MKAIREDPLAEREDYTLDHERPHNDDQADEDSTDDHKPAGVNPAWSLFLLEFMFLVLLLLEFAFLLMVLVLLFLVVHGISIESEKERSRGISKPSIPAGRRLALVDFSKSAGHHESSGSILICFSNDGFEEHGMMTLLFPLEEI